MKNMITTNLTAEEREEIEDLITQLEQKLAGKTIALTEEERSRYGAINEQNKLLVNKVRDYREHSPALSSPDVDWDEFESDYQTRQFMERNANRLGSLVYQMNSTRILHDHDVIQVSLTEYAHAKYRKDVGEAGYAEKVAELRQFFNRTGTSKKNKPAPPAAED